MKKLTDTDMRSGAAFPPNAKLGSYGRALCRLSERLGKRRLGAIHTPADFRRHARARLPAMVFDYVEGGAGREDSLRRNREAIDGTKLVPRGPFDVSHRDMSVSFFGQRFSMPVVIGPTGLASASWPYGEIALAEAAAEHNIAFVLANATSIDPESVIRAAPEHSWFQLYPPPNREIARQWIRRIRGAGFSVLEVTVDVADPGRRLRDARNSFALPFRWTPAKFLDVARKPLWALSMLHQGTPTPSLVVEADEASSTAANQSEKRRNRFTRALSWDLLKSIREEWPGPALVKGLLDPRQTDQAVSAGFDGVVISNHGGRQLDGTVAALDVLPEFRRQAGGRIQLLVDGGFETGVDVAKAIALGADAVQLGRMPVFALATAGRPGVMHALDLLRAEIENTMALCGVASIAEFRDVATRRI